MDKIHQDENINTDCKDNQNNHHNPGQNGLMECKKGRNDRSIQKSFPRLTNGAIRKTDKGQRIKLKSRVKKLVETKKVVEHEENPESNMEVTPPPKPVTIIKPVPDIIQCSDEPNSCNGTQSELPGKDDSKLISERSCKARQTKQKINPVQENVKYRYSLTTCPVCLKKMQRKSVPRHILDVHKVKFLSSGSNGILKGLFIMVIQIYLLEMSKLFLKNFLSKNYLKSYLNFFKFKLSLLIVHDNQQNLD